MATNYQTKEFPAIIYNVINIFLSILLFIFLLAEIYTTKIDFNFRYILEIIFLPYIILRLNKSNFLLKNYYGNIKSKFNLFWSIIFLILGSFGIISYLIQSPVFGINGDVITILLFSLGLLLLIFYLKFIFEEKNFTLFKNIIKYLSYADLFLTVILLGLDLLSNLMNLNEFNLGNKVGGIFFMDTVFAISVLTLLAVFLYLLWNPKQEILDVKNFLKSSIPTWFIFLIISIFYIELFFIMIMISDPNTGRDLFQSTIRNALFTGSIYLLLGIGLTLVYKILGFANFAHGELVIFGSYICITYFGTINFGFFPTLFLFIIIAFISSSVLALAGDQLVFKPLRNRKAEAFSLMIASIGVSIIIRFSIANFFGVRAKGVIIPNEPYLNVIKAIIFFLAILLVILLELLLKKTKIGKAMRAMADNKNLAEVCGISPSLIIVLVWVIGAGLAGIGGLLRLIANASLIPSFGFTLLLPTFAVVILGGIGSYRGAIIAGYIIGFAENFGTFILIYIRQIKDKFIIDIPILLGNLSIHNFEIAFSFSQEYQISIGFIILIVVLLIKPTGILGEEIVRER